MEIGAPLAMQTNGLIRPTFSFSLSEMGVRQALGSGSTDFSKEKASLLLLTGLLCEALVPGGNCLIFSGQASL